MPNKFLVIGSNSFSGAQFIKYLLENGNNVIGVSRSNEINDVYLPYKWGNKKENFKFLVVERKMNVSPSILKTAFFLQSLYIQKFDLRFIIPSNL